MSPQLQGSSSDHQDAVSRPHSPGADSTELKPTVICVFCGSSPGKSPAHIEAARALGRALHDHKIKLVYGAGTTGIMGEVARTLVSLSGPEAVHGIIPNALKKFEQADQSKPEESGNDPDSATKANDLIYGKTTVVPNMHVRKQMMAKEVIQGGPGSGFIALTGGLGTLEELAEMSTWNQLGIHKRGVVVFNVEDFWTPLIEWNKKAVASGFIAPGNAGIIVEARSAEESILALKNYAVASARLNLDVGTLTQKSTSS